MLWWFYNSTILLQKKIKLHQSPSSTKLLDLHPPGKLTGKWNSSDKSVNRVKVKKRWEWMSCVVCPCTAHLARLWAQTGDMAKHRNTTGSPKFIPTQLCTWVGDQWQGAASQQAINYHLSAKSRLCLPESHCLRTCLHRPKGLVPSSLGMEERSHSSETAQVSAQPPSIPPWWVLKRTQACPGGCFGTESQPLTQISSLEQRKHVPGLGIYNVLSESQVEDGLKNFS